MSYTYREYRAVALVERDGSSVGEVKGDWTPWREDAVETADALREKGCTVQVNVRERDEYADLEEVPSQ